LTAEILRQPTINHHGPVLTENKRCPEERGLSSGVVNPEVDLVYQTDAVLNFSGSIPPPRGNSRRNSAEYVDVEEFFPGDVR